MRARRSVAVAMVTLLGVPAFAGVSRAVPGAESVVFINEIHYDNVGTDVGEAVEVAAPDGTDLAGWSIVLYNGNGGAPYATLALSGVAADQSGGYGTVSVLATGLQNGAPDGVALAGPTGAVVQFLSYEGTFVAVGGPADGQTSTDIGVAETGTEAVGLSLQLTGSGDSAGDFTWQAPASATPGALSAGQSFAGGPPPPPPPPAPPLPCPDPPALSPIGRVQGTTDVSPCVGRSVVVEGVVIGDYEGPSPALRGFYVQEQDAEHDTDPLTSEGVFVFNGNTNSVALGDVVTVTGMVSEFQGQTQISAAAGGVRFGSSGATVTPAGIAFPLASTTALESVEGMLATIAQPMFVTEHFQLGRFGEVVVSAGGRQAQPTAIAEPGTDAAGVASANALNRIKIDDDSNAQNPDPIKVARGGQPLSASNTLRGGDSVSGLTGVLTYSFGGSATASPNTYRLRVVGDLSDSGLVAGGVVPNFQPENPRPAAAPALGGTVQVASFNVLNYFLTLDAGTNLCGPTTPQVECRGAESAAEFTRQRDKLLTALDRLDADVIGLIELENTPGVEPLADLAAGLNERTGSTTWTFVDTGVIGTDVIKVGYIYDSATVTPIGDFAVLNEAVDPRFDTSLNRPALAQSFVDGGGEVFTVVVNHFKSKGCTDATGANLDQLDGQGCWNPVRVAAAQALADWVLAGPTGVADTDVLVIGDLNAYAKEDPIDALTAAGLIDLAPLGSYSFAFDGQWGSLDYALVTPSLAAQVTGFAKDHINADEPSVLDYDTNFKSAAQIASLYATDEFRTSDHDPVLVGLGLDGVRAHVIVFPDRLWAVNGRLQPVVTVAFGRSGLLPVRIADVVSSEADSGLGPRDRPGDIVVLNDWSVLLRAERFADEGRTYTLTLHVSEAGQLEVITRTVHVGRVRR